MSQFVNFIIVVFIFQNNGLEIEIFIRILFSLFYQNVVVGNSR